jgi:hypothetical protein
MIRVCVTAKTKQESLHSLGMETINVWAEVRCRKRAVCHFMANDSRGFSPLFHLERQRKEKLLEPRECPSGAAVRERDPALLLASQLLLCS